MSKIEWTEETWNPIAGCTIVSEGCKNCYAMRIAHKIEVSRKTNKYDNLTKIVADKAVWNGNINIEEKAIELPYSWKSPKLVFVNSMSDLFHENLSKKVFARIWEVMMRTPRHTYQILTKRPERIQEAIKGLPLIENVWLGVSVENAKFRHRIDALRKSWIRAKFISFEPLIASAGELDLKDINWIIVGGESGYGARPMAQKWVDEIFVACQKAHVPFFFKQRGGEGIDKGGNIYKGRRWNEIPIKQNKQQELL